jgi:hypothetical protein
VDNSNSPWDSDRSCESGYEFVGILVDVLNDIFRDRLGHGGGVEGCFLWSRASFDA